MNFSDFKKNKDKFSNLTKKMVKPSDNNYADSRFWKPSKDDVGNGEALIRFLPQKNVEKNPFILNFQHFFKEKGKYFVEKCPVTWEKTCPVCDFVQPFWDGTKDDQKIAGKYGRKRSYTANILVLKDPLKPENNGKVFLYRFGKKIFDKIVDKISPNSELDEECIVYDLWEGRNFKLKIKKVYGYANYDTSEFADASTPVGKSDKEIEVVYNSIFALDEFIDEKECKSAKVLGDKFFSLIGKTSPVVDKELEKKKVEVEKVEEVEEELTESKDEESFTEETKEEETTDNEDTDKEEDWDWD